MHDLGIMKFSCNDRVSKTACCELENSRGEYFFFPIALVSKNFLERE